MVPNIDFTTIHGNAISNGGGDITRTDPNGLVFPIKDTVIDGNVIVRVLLDQHSGEIVRVTRIRDRSVATWIDQVTGDVHYGRFLGIFSRAAWVLLGFAPLVLLVTAVLMWWNRTASKWFRRVRSV